MHRPERAPQLGVGELGRVKPHLRRLGVARGFRADLLVARAGHPSCGIADARLRDTLDLTERRLDSPEAPGRECRALQPVDVGPGLRPASAPAFKAARFGVHQPLPFLSWVIAYIDPASSETVRGPRRRRTFLRPRAVVRLLAQPVDARQRPEVHQDDVAVQLGGAEWLGVEPPGRPAKRGDMQTVGHRSSRATGMPRGALLRTAAAPARPRSARLDPPR